MAMPITTTAATAAISAVLPRLRAGSAGGDVGGSGTTAEAGVNASRGTRAPDAGAGWLIGVATGRGGNSGGSIGMPPGGVSWSTVPGGGVGLPESGVWKSAPGRWPGA
ncbi:hypothetical protein DKM19_03775 [Streptosporangium sp. 'caverna']|nr:hypothetical protein DKM19_03775 [Streptosporangium sp. 'caverna']